LWEKDEFYEQTSKFRANISYLWEKSAKIWEKIDHVGAKIEFMSKAQHPKQHFYQIGKKINFMSKTSKLRAKILNLWETFANLWEKIHDLGANIRINEQNAASKEFRIEFLWEKLNFMSKTSKLRAKIPNLWGNSAKIWERIDHVGAKIEFMSKAQHPVNFYQILKKYLVRKSLILWAKHLNYEQKF
jgi:uncharacterized coiled-coil DUF342 family protein